MAVLFQEAIVGELSLGVTAGDGLTGVVKIGALDQCALGPVDRQLNDQQLSLLIARDAVIGTAFDAWMLHPGWRRGETSPSVVGIAAAADHIDHICQLAGNARHCAIGSDLDGGFGTEQTPRDLDTITDLHALEEILSRRGYRPEQIDGIFFGNWLHFFGRALPESDL